jgi:hypothetical protein
MSVCSKGLAPFIAHRDQSSTLRSPSEREARTERTPRDEDADRDRELSGCYNPERSHPVPLMGHSDANQESRKARHSTSRNEP